MLGGLPIHYNLPQSVLVLLNFLLLIATSHTESNATLSQCDIEFTLKSLNETLFVVVGVVGVAFVQISSSMIARCKAYYLEANQVRHSLFS